LIFNLDNRSEKYVYTQEIKNTIYYQSAKFGKYSLFADDNYLDCYNVHAINDSLSSNTTSSSNNISGNVTLDTWSNLLVDSMNDNMILTMNQSNQENIVSNAFLIVSEFEDNVSKSKLSQKFKNLTIEKVNKKSINKLKLRSLKNIDSMNDVQFISKDRHNKFPATDIVYANIANVTNATVQLSKLGKISIIVRCDDYNPVDNSCTQWTPTDIPFTDYGTYIEFTVDHFSAYQGIVVITKALHLDKNREYISDIFGQVNIQDEIWSEAIEVQEMILEVLLFIEKMEMKV
jgi:hypothetical protein